MDSGVAGTQSAFSDAEFTKSLTTSVSALQRLEVSSSIDFAAAVGEQRQQGGREDNFLADDACRTQRSRKGAGSDANGSRLCFARRSVHAVAARAVEFRAAGQSRVPVVVRAVHGVAELGRATALRAAVRPLPGVGTSVAAAGTNGGSGCCAARHCQHRTCFRCRWLRLWWRWCR